MPAPKSLSGLPKPVLFGLYGAVGGLLGALIFAEPLHHLLTPRSRPTIPEPQVAVAASEDVEVFLGGQNTFPVQIAREGFTAPVTIRLEDLPAGLSAEPVTIPADKTEGEVRVIGARNATVVVAKQAKVIAEGEANGKTATAQTTVSFKVTDPAQPLADIVFVLDVTNSMQWAIDDLKNGIGNFASSLGKAHIDFRLGLVTFQDISNPGEGVEVVQFKGGPFTADADTFRDQVSHLEASGGGDIPESSLEGITEACKLPFRKNATKMLLLVTDAPPKVIPPGNTNSAVQSVAELVRNSNIDSVQLVVWPLDKDVYQPLLEAGTDKSGGKVFDLKEVVVGDEGFDGLLTTFGGVVTAAAIAKNPENKPHVAERSKGEPKVVRSLQSSEQSAAGSEGRIVLRSGVWTGAIAALICLMLLGGQQHYLRGSLPKVGGVIVGLLGGLAVGLVGGVAGQGLFFLAPNSAILAHIFRIFGWALLGGLAGMGLSLFIPNMKWVHGLGGGAIGGSVGAVGFILVSASTGELVGRLVGGLVLGLGIGLMVAIAETAFRRAWLEVKFGERETITVTLGAEPVKVGSDAKACTVWARGAPPVALRFFVRNGKVICDDKMADRESVVGDGFEKEVGTLTVTVHTGSGPAKSKSARPQRSKPKTTPKPARVSIDTDDDDFDLPMPVTASSPPLAPAPPPPPAAVPAPRPVPPPVSVSVPVSPPPVPPRPAPTPPTPPKPPVPVISKPPVPHVPSVAQPQRPPTPPTPPAPKPAVPASPPSKPAARNPNACPSCGRIIAGQPGQRYCMICDQKF